MIEITPEQMTICYLFILGCFGCAVAAVYFCMARFVDKHVLKGH